MIRLLIGLDDTDDAAKVKSTARLAREIGASLSERGRLIGVAAHLLHRGEDLKATTNNKASCIVLDCEPNFIRSAFDRACELTQASAGGSSGPGVIMDVAGGKELTAFGEAASRRLMSPEELAPLLIGRESWGQGSKRGLIGAAAAIGLTAAGRSGRWIEYGGLRGLERVVRAQELYDLGIRLFSVETDAETPAPTDWVDTHGWLRPMLLGGEAAAPLRRISAGAWEVLGAKTRRRSEGATI
jgi:hypothetical protein